MKGHLLLKIDEMNLSCVDVDVDAGAAVVDQHVRFDEVHPHLR